MADEGWIVVSRALLDTRHDLHPQSAGTPACELGAWVDLIGYARWKESGGLKRGQCRASENFLAARWNWSRSRVHRFLVDLEAAGRIERIEQPGARRANIISICNYDTYQDPRTTSEPPPEHQQSTERTTNETQEEPEPQPERRKKNQTAAVSAGEENHTDLSDWLTDDYNHALPDLSLYTQRAIYGLVGPDGTRTDIWGDIAPERWPPLTKSAIDSYLASKGGDSWHQGFFLSIVEGAVRSARRPGPMSEAAAHAGRDETHELEAERARTLREQAEAKSRAEEKRLNAEGEKAARQAKEARAWYEDQPPEVQQQVDEAAKRRLQALGFRGSPGTVPKVLQATALVKAIQEIRQEATV